MVIATFIYFSHTQLRSKVHVLPQSDSEGAQEDTECLEPQIPPPVSRQAARTSKGDVLCMYIVDARGGRESDLVPNVVISEADVFDARGAMFTNIDRD